MSLLKYRSRLRSIKSLNLILSALQVVTVVRMKRVKEKYSAIQNYLDSAKDVLAGRLNSAACEKKLLIVITSNRGLCGMFNAQAIKKAASFLGDDKETSLVILGRRGMEYFRRNRKILFSNSEIIERPTFRKSADIFKQIFDPKAEVFVAYNSYQSTAVQIPKIYRLYPVPEELNSRMNCSDFILEPNPRDMIDDLFYHYLETRFFQLILDSQMGELAARLMVLKGAVDNSKDLIDDLVISINKARQNVITRDLSEIIGSAEALRRTSR